MGTRIDKRLGKQGRTECGKLFAGAIRKTKARAKKLVKKLDKNKGKN